MNQIVSRESSGSDRVSSEATTFRRLTTNALIFLTVLNLLNYLDRYLVAALLPTMMQEFKLSNTQGGVLQSSFVIGYVLFAPVFGFLGDRRGRPRLMCFGLVVWSLATIWTGCAQSYEEILAARVMVGIGEASFAALAPGYIRDGLANVAATNRALALFFAAIPVGSALGFIASGALATIFGWQQVFFIAGALGLLGAPSLLFRTEYPRPKAEHKSFAEVGIILRERNYLRAVIGYALNAFALNGLATFMTSMALERGLAIGPANIWIGGLLVCSGFLGTWGGGIIASKGMTEASNAGVERLFRAMAWSSLIGVPFLVLALTRSTPVAFLGWLFVAELCIFAATAPVNTALVSVVPPRASAKAQALAILILNLFGSLLAPIIVGRVADSGSLFVGGLISAAALAASGVVWGLKWGTSPGARTSCPPAM